MCGISGHYSVSSNFGDVEKSLSCFRHRGPDVTATMDFPMIRLGYNRLAITDVSSGFQPLYNSDKSIVVFYNGEIYNHLKLREGLAGKERVNRLVDGAVIPHLYENYGEKFHEKLHGMYAIALYDIKKDKLILCRDSVGEKPLYFWNYHREVKFSSSLLGLKSLLHEEPELDIQSLWDYPSFLWVPEPQTPFKSVNSVMPGQALIFEHGSIARTLQKVRLPMPSNKMQGEILEQELSGIITKSIISMVPEEVPFGAFLSSGLDSSIVSTVISREFPEKQFETFCVEFPDVADPYHRFADESILAKEYSELLGTSHHTIKADSKSLLSALDDFVKFSDSPFAVSSGLGVMLVAEKAKELGLRVLLSGDGADELYGGYSWYPQLKSLCQVNNSYTKKKSGSIDVSGVTFQSRNLSLNKLVEIVGSYPPSELAFALHYYMLESEKKSIFSKWVSSQVQSSYRHTEVGDNAKLNPIDFINHDRKLYLTQEMMRKVDRFTMAHSIEGRVPFVSQESLNFSYGLSFEKLTSGEDLKPLLRGAFSNKLPPTIAKRAKHGVNVPIDYWLKKDWFFLVEEAFSKSSMLSEFQLIDEGALNFATNLIFNPSKLNGHSVFSFIILEKWLGYVYGGNKA